MKASGEGFHGIVELLLGHMRGHTYVRDVAVRDVAVNTKDKVNFINMYVPQRFYLLLCCRQLHKCCNHTYFYPLERLHGSDESIS